MKQYSAYHLQILSEIRLPGYTEVVSEISNVSNSVVEIYIRHITKSASKEDHENDNILIGEAPSVLNCRIEDGRKIIVNPNPDADFDFVRSVVGGELMAALLRQRGYLVLHGACLSKNDIAFGIVGYSGWGKSTTAGYFLNAGYQLLGEDLLVVDVTQPTPTVLPGPQGLRLRPDAASWLRYDDKRGEKIYNATRKRIYSIGKTDNHSIPLGKIYLLEGEGRQSNSILSMSGIDIMMELVKHTRNMKWLNDQSFLRAHFNQCSTLINKVPVAMLQRKRSLDSLPEIKELIEEDLRKEIDQRIIPDVVEV